jgi:2-iminobutanoate/2-iminopropanoate deaminase
MHPTTGNLILAAALALGATGSRPTIAEFHLGPWEQEIGYSQAVKVGNHLYVSGTIGNPESGLEDQLKQAYQGIQKTMDAYRATFGNVVVERIYTTDIEELKKLQDTRKKIYGDRLPAATWVEVRRLYLPGAKLEIEVELVL